MEEYVLPEWAFLDAHSHQGNQLGNRTVILHIRSASVIEIIDRNEDKFIPIEGVLKLNFKYTHHLVVERLSAILHYCVTLDQEMDKEQITDTILRPCAKWYCDYCAWEDKNILNNSFEDE